MRPAASDAHVTIVAEGFPPIIGPGARVLILGTLPSRQSLQKHQYYGHPQNAFWKIMGELFAAGPDLGYAERARRLVRNGVAVWDVLASSARPGSMDSAIDLATARANDFAALPVVQPEIRLICFNGQTAARLFDRLVSEAVRNSFRAAKFVTMPSTSPAYAAMSFADKLERWSEISAELEKEDFG